MSEVKKCEEHPHLSYYADLDLHVELALAERKRHSPDQTATSTNGDDLDSQNASENPIGTLRKVLIYSRFFLLLVLVMLGIPLLGVLIFNAEIWASTLVEVEHDDTSLAVLETRRVGGLVGAIGFGLLFLGVAGLSAVKGLFSILVPPKVFMQKKSMVGILAVLFLASIPFVSDLIAPRHMTVTIDREADRITGSRDYFFRADVKSSVTMSEIQSIEISRHSSGEAKVIYLVMFDGSKIEYIDHNTPGYRNVLAALLRVTDLPYEETYVDQR